MRKVMLKEGIIKYYHVYPLNSKAQYGVVFKLQGSNISNLECMTKGVSKEKMVNDCKLIIEEGELKSVKEYIVTKISLNRAIRKIEDSKRSFSIQNWSD